MPSLLIRHRGNAESADAAEFEVQRVDARGARAAPLVKLTDPLSRKLAGSDLDLGHELAW